MQLAIVVGHVHSTVKHETLQSQKMLIAQPLQIDGATPDGSPILVVDRCGAGAGDQVILTSDGAAIRDIFALENSPIRWAVLGIVDGKS